MKLKEWRKAHTQQFDHMDCGAACLKTVLNYHGYDHIQLESIKELCGTTTKGTSLLGLMDAANAYKLKAEGFEATVNDLKELKNYCILHVEKERQAQHYLLLITYQDGKFIVSDPEEPNLQCLSEESIDEIWKSRKLLLLSGLPQIDQGEEGKKKFRFETIFQLIRSNSKLLGVIALIGVISSFLELSTALFTQQLIDRLIPQDNFEKLIIGLISWLVLLLFSAVLAFLRQYLLAKQSYMLNTSIVQHFLGKLFFMPKRFFDSKKTGDLIARLNDTQQIEEIVRRLFSSTMIEGLFIIIGILFLFIYKPLLAGLALLLIPLYALSAWFFTPKIISTQKRAMSTFAETESRFIDSIQSIEDIKIANQESNFQTLSIRTYNLHQKANYELERLVARFNLVLELLGVVSLVLIITNSLFFILREELSIGELVAILPIGSLVIASITSSSLIALEFQGSKIAFERMEEFTQRSVDEGDEEKELPNDSISVIELKDLSFRFNGQNLLLSELNLSLYVGQWYSVLGESGSGKSTLLQLLQKFYLPTEGVIEANGINLTELNTSSWHSKVACVPQSIHLHYGTLIENICMDSYSEENENAVIKFCQLYDFDTYFSNFPNGYYSVLGDGGIQISGGQQQLVALARALYQNPQILLLDEATSAMDRKMEKFALDLIHSLKGYLIILLVTHRPFPVKYSDYVFIIDQKIQAKGTPSELRAGKNLYADLLSI